MPTQLTPGEDDPVAIMACIGHVCVQWSLLEQVLINILAACQNIPMDEAAILFGGLDMKPRLNMAINLTEHHRWKPSLRKRLRALRTSIDKQKLVDRRNLIVHGLQTPSDMPSVFTLYTPRRKGAAQEETWTITEAQELGSDIYAAACEAYSILSDYGGWKFGEHNAENSGGEVMAAKAGILTRIKQHIRARLYSFGR